MVAFAADLEIEAPSGPLPFDAAVAVAVEDDGVIAGGFFRASLACSEKQGEATFTGYSLDEETGLYYARNRMYSSQLGRFANRDSMGYINGMSLYQAYFVPGDTDPLGLLTTAQTKKIIDALRKCNCESGYDWNKAILKAGEIGYGTGWQDRVASTASELGNGVEKAKSAVSKAQKLLQNGATMKEVISAISGFDYHPGGTFGDLGKSLSAVEDLGKMKDVLEKLSTTLTIAETTSLLSKGKSMTGVEAAQALSNIYGLTSGLTNIPGAGSYIEFVGKSLEAITKGLGAINDSVNDKQLTIMLDSCAAWVEGPYGAAGSELWDVWKAGNKP